MRKFYISIIILICTSQFAFSQCPPPGFPDSGDACSDAPLLCVNIDGYCNTINNNNTQQNFPGCSGGWVLNNDEWFQFCAGSTTISIQVTPSNCTNNGGNQGLQASIYSACPPTGSNWMAHQCSCTTNPFTLTSSNYVIGQSYWFVLDGCAGDVCDYTIDVLNGSTLCPDPPSPGPLTGPNPVCAGSNGLYVIPVVNGASFYTWTLTPASAGTLVGANNNDAQVNWASNFSGTATLCVGAGNSCYPADDTICMTITVDPKPTAIISGSGVLCAGSGGAIDLTVTFTGVGPWTFTPVLNGAPQAPITTSSNPYTLQVTQAGTWTIAGLVMSDPPSCTGTTSGTAVISTVTLTHSATTVNAICGSNTGSVNLTVGGGSSPYAYIWSGGEITQDLSNVPPGTYTVTITDNNNCTATHTATVGNTVPNINPTATTVAAVCGQSNGSLDLSVTGGTAPYTYLWSGGETTQDLSNIPSGTYTVTVTDVNGCTGTNAITVANNTININLSATTLPNTVCNGNNNGSINLSVQPGGTYTFNWSNGATTEDISNLPPGSYSVTVTSGVNCTAVGNFTVADQPNIPNGNATTVQTTCDLSNGSVNLTPSGGVPPYTFLWSNGATTEDLSNVPAGSYTVTITGANGCTRELTFTVNNTNPPINIASAIVSNTTCNGNGNGSINITVTPPATYTFAWSNGATTEDISNLLPGSYSVTVTGQGSCSATANFTVPDAPLNPGGSAIPTQSTCDLSNGSVNLTPSGGVSPYTFLWSNGATSEDLSNVPAGTYSVTITGANGCTHELSVTVNNNNPPITISSTIVANTNCNGNGNGSINISIVPPSTYTFVWSNGATTEDISNLLPGSYSVTVTGQGSCTATGDFTVPDSPLLPNVSFTTIQTTCDLSNGSINLSVSGGVPPYTFAWSNGSTTEDLSNIPAGAYSVTVTGANGCTRDADITVNNTNPPINVSGNVVGNTTCNGSYNGSVSITVTPPGNFYTYLWSNGATTQNISNLPSGVYDVTVTGLGTCFQVASFFVPENANVPIVATTFVQTTCDLPNGSASITVSGSVPPYTFLWSNGATTQNLTGITAGTYEVTVTGANGCTTVRTIDIPNFNPPINVTAVVVDNTTCTNGNGSINVSVTPPANYTYTWSNGATTQDISNLLPGPYSVTVSNGGTCIEVQNYFIDDIPNEPNLPFSQVDANCGLSNGSINLSVNGGVSPFTYQWSNGATTQDLNNIPADIYSVTVTGSNGCTNVAGIVLNDNVIPVNIDAVVKGLTSCITNNGSIALMVTPANATILWDNGSTAPTRNNLAPGTYSVTVSAGGTCTETATFEIYDETEYPALTADITAGYCSISNGSINLEVTGGATPYTYKWSTNAMTQDLANLPEGTYTVTVTSALGCSSETTVFVPNNDIPILLNGNPYDNLSCVPPYNGAIDLDVDPAGYNYIYNWSNGLHTQNLGNLAPGLYSVTVTLGTTCSASGTYEVINSAVAPNISVGGLPATCGLGNGGADLTIGGASPPYTYHWSTNATTEDLSNVPPGNYSVTATDFFGCSATASVVVTNNNVVLNVSGVMTENTSCAVANGALNISVSPTGAYNYTWSNSAATEDITGLIAGSYTVTVSAGTSCSSTATFIVTNNTSDPDISPVITAAICTNPNGAIDLSVTGAQTPYTFNWSNSVATEDQTGLLPGTYSVTVTGANGCTADTILFVPNNSSTFSLAGATQPLTNCATPNGSIDLTVTPSGPYTYQWSNSALTQDVANLPAGIYTVSVTETGTCTASISFIIPDDRTFPATAQAIAAEICNLQNGSIDLTVSGGVTPYSFIWTGGLMTEDLPNVPDGTYVVTVTGANNCTATATAIVPDNSVSFAIGGTPTDNTSCVVNNGAIDVNVNPANPGSGLSYTYVWSNTLTTEDLSSLPAGIYVVTVSAGGTCTNTANYTISDDTQAPIIAEAVLAAFCGQSSGSVDLTVSGGQTPYGYVWSTTAVSEDLNNIPPGNYSVTVTGGNGCTSVDAYVIPENVIIPTITGIPTTNTSCISNNGALTLSVSPNLAYTYQWGTGQTTPNLVNIPGGNYSVTVSAGGSCTAEASFNVPSDVAVVSLGGSTTNVLCFGNNTGAINLTVNGGNGPLIYSWLPAAGNIEDLSSLAAGTYQVTVTDINGCSSSTTFAITQPANSLQIACSNVNDLTSPTALDGTGAVNIGGGTAPYNVIWSPGGVQGNVIPGIFSLNNLDQGSYLVTVTDANGCPAQCGFNIGLVPCTTSLGTMGNSLISLCGTGCITANYSAVGQFLDPDDVLQFVLHEGSGNQIVNEIARSNQPSFCFNQATMNYGTTYYISAIAGNADPSGNVIIGAYCTVISAPTPIAFFEKPVAAINPPALLNCAVQEVFLIGSSSLPGASFAWTTNGGLFIGAVNQANAKAGKAGPYTLTINVNGCKDTTDVVVTDITNNPIATIAATPDDLLDCVINEITLLGTAEGTFNVNTIWISGGNTYTPGTTLLINDPGTYQFVILDTLTQCSDTAVIIINEDLAYPALFLNPPGLLTCTNPTVTLVGGSPFSGIQFKWATIAGSDTTIVGTGTTLAVTTPGTYWLFGIDPVNQCKNSMSTTVNANQVYPVAEAGAGFSMKCFGETANLDGTGSSSVGAINFVWTTNNGNLVSGANTATPLISKPGTYVLLVTNPANGCTDSDDVLINPIDPTVMTTVTQPPCYGDKGSIIVNEVIGGQPPVLFSLNNGPFSTQSAFLNLEAGNYTVVVQDAEGCSVTVSAVLIEPVEFQIEISPDTIIDLGGYYEIYTQINLPLSQIQSILWTPSTGLSCDTCLNLVATPFISTQYKVVVKTDAGCRDDATLRLLVDRRVDVYIPNVFSPNDDGDNDIFTVFADIKGVKKINSLQVYSRWGELLWERFDFPPNDLSLGWDGTYRGLDMNPAVFVYQAEIEFIDGRKELYKGDVTIVR